MGGHQGYVSKVMARRTVTTEATRAPQNLLQVLPSKSIQFKPPAENITEEVDTLQVQKGGQGNNNSAPLHVNDDDGYYTYYGDDDDSGGSKLLVIVLAATTACVSLFVAAGVAVIVLKHVRNPKQGAGVASGVRGAISSADVELAIGGEKPAKQSQRLDSSQQIGLMHSMWELMSSQTSSGPVSFDNSNGARGHLGSRECSLGPDMCPPLSFAVLVLRPHRLHICSESIAAIGACKGEGPVKRRMGEKSIGGEGGEVRAGHFGRRGECSEGANNRECTAARPLLGAWSQVVCRSAISQVHVCLTLNLQAAFSKWC